MLKIEKQWYLQVIGQQKLEHNFPQGRVTEHRINLTKYNLQATISGDVQEFIDELHLAENAEKLKSGSIDDQK